MFKISKKCTEIKKKKKVHFYKQTFKITSTLTQNTAKYQHKWKNTVDGYKEVQPLYQLWRNRRCKNATDANRYILLLRAVYSICILFILRVFYLYIYIYCCCAIVHISILGCTVRVSFELQVCIFFVKCHKLLNTIFIIN